MVDKNRPTHPTPKGAAYCDRPGTTCMYNDLDVCVNCGRSKGWRRKLKEEASPPTERLLLNTYGRRCYEAGRERVLKSFATMLGWENVPPQDTLEREICALKARAALAAPPHTPQGSTKVQMAEMTPAEAGKFVRHIAESTALSSQTWDNFQQICESMITSAMEAGRSFGRNESVVTPDPQTFLGQLRAIEADIRAASANSTIGIGQQLAWADRLADVLAALCQETPPETYGDMKCACGHLSSRHAYDHADSDFSCFDCDCESYCYPKGRETR